ncbi:hypothetical protein SNN61_002551 [Cronobacter sakazakii]|uniref:hypothetical protein n=1 Tax=Cronobacter sakazakii TaxID=28141 RepID=UPI002895DD2F|nr:hypothetical protein [Cronobacter sakazakii]EIZ9234941.1 hypothetical protein [Cronobacter sakazakii]ELY4093972.1 hypothetical protein [Cronobacter sakazakii]ELY4405961.1 hypothetical protein [Cronobacter sakazakii]ELY4465192.1 hypothetical protein [Cronobacter sakazakii]ELY5896810.1 hypothetical protein [Cronobacter sakazakii]
MKEFKGTPGPWEWWTSNSFLRLSSQATGKDGGVIDSYAMSDGHTSLSVSKADMALIAAAPDLLEALNSIMELQTRGYVVLGDKCTEMARAAIAKAIGEEE